MTGERSIREREASWLLLDVDDATGRKGPQAGDANKKHDGFLLIDPCVTQYDFDAYTGLNPPLAKCRHGTLENIFAATKASRVSVVTVADGHPRVACRADLGVRRPGFRRARKHGVNRHLYSFPARRPSDPAARQPVGRNPARVA